MSSLVLAHTPGEDLVGRRGYPPTYVLIGVQIFAGGPVDAVLVPPPWSALFHPPTAPAGVTRAW